MGFVSSFKLYLLFLDYKALYLIFLITARPNTNLYCFLTKYTLNLEHEFNVNLVKKVFISFYLVKTVHKKL